MTSAEERWLAALQQGIPLTARPFESLALDCGCSEDDLLAFIGKCRADGLVRRFGAVFDTRRLGYKSVLCAARVPAEDLDAAAAKLTPLVGVTHCYIREPMGENAPLCGAAPDNVHKPAGENTPLCGDMPSLWFTLSYPKDVFAAMADEVAARLAPHELFILPATIRYKVDVVFGGATRTRDEATEDDSPAVSARDRAVISALQGDTDARSDYFAALSEKTGLREWDLLSCLEMWRRSGRLKRIGLLLSHRNAGWTANGMCCWRVDGDTRAAGRALAARDEVTHCYERPSLPCFPFNLFAMVHARSAADANAQFRTLSDVLAETLPDREIPSTMLLSTKEYKKTSMTFFADALRA